METACTLPPKSWALCSPNLELCLSVNRALPYKRSPVYLVSSINRIYAYAYYKAFFPRPLPWALSLNRTHSYFEGHRYFAEKVYFARKFSYSHPLKLCCDDCHVEISPQIFIVLKCLRKINQEVRLEVSEPAPAKVVLLTHFILHLTWIISQLAIMLAETPHTLSRLALFLNCMFMCVCTHLWLCEYMHMCTKRLGRELEPWSWGYRCFQGARLLTWVLEPKLLSSCLTSHISSLQISNLKKHGLILLFLYFVLTWFSHCRESKDSKVSCMLGKFYSSELHPQPYCSIRKPL